MTVSCSFMAGFEIYCHLFWNSIGTKLVGMHCSSLLKLGYISIWLSLFWNHKQQELNFRSYDCHLLILDWDVLVQVASVDAKLAIVFTDFFFFFSFLFSFYVLCYSPTLGKL